MAKQVFKYEKEHKKDPRVCKRCGKRKKDYIISGLCEQCTKELMQEKVSEQQNRRYWVVNEKEAKEMNIK